MKALEINIDGGLEIVPKLLSLEEEYTIKFLGYTLKVFRTCNSIEIYDEKDWMNLKDLMERQIK